MLRQRLMALESENACLKAAVDAFRHANSDTPTLDAAVAEPAQTARLPDKTVETTQTASVIGLTFGRGQQADWPPAHIAEFKLLEAVLRHMRAGVIVAEAPSGRIVLHNAAAERLLGHAMLPVRDVSDYGHYGGAHPDGTPYKAKSYPIARALLHGEVVDQEEILYRRGDGQMAVLSVDATPVWDESDRIGLAICTFQDLSDRKAMEQALRTGEERLSMERGFLDAVIRQAPVGISIIEAPTGRALVLNDKAVDLLGHGQLRTDLNRFEDYGAVHADGRPYAVEDYPTTRAVRQGEVVDQEEMIYRRGDGQTTRLTVSSAPVRASDGRLVGAVTVFQDVEERRRMEEALRASEERFRALVENAPPMMWVNTPDGNVELFNRAWRAYTGQSETPDSTEWAEVIHPEDRARMLELRARSIASSAPYSVELRIRRTDGLYRWHIGQVHPMRLKGEVFAWVGTALDIDDIRQAREEAEQANRAKSRFLAVASHDLRQPLQSLLFFLEALRPHVTDAVGEETLVHLGRGLDAMKDLLDSLLDISRLEAGAVETALEDFAVGRVLDLLATSYAPVAAAKGLTLKAGPCTTWVRSDPILLGRMIRNLIENALRYTDAGEVRLECRQLEGRLWIDIVDTGCGIPSEHLVSIWEEFHQVGNAERDRNRGLGLGLAIVQRLSELLHHPVMVRSVPGQGSTFSVSVPLVEAAADHPSMNVSARGRNGGFVVVIDDDAIVLTGLQAILQAWGYEVMIAGATEDLLTRLAGTERLPDIIIADYRLRGGQFGTEAVEKVRRLFGVTIPAFLLTGETGPEYAREAAVHSLAVLHKPITPKQLKSALEEYVKKAQG